MKWFVSVPTMLSDIQALPETEIEKQQHSCFLLDVPNHLGHIPSGAGPGFVRQYVFPLSIKFPSHTHRQFAYAYFHTQNRCSYCTPKHQDARKGSRRTKDAISVTLYTSAYNIISRTCFYMVWIMAKVVSSHREMPYPRTGVAQCLITEKLKIREL